MKMKELFVKRPPLGTRGNHALWDWLEKEINPDIDIMTREATETYIYALLGKKVGADFYKDPKDIDEKITIEEFKKGHGLSDGQISVRSWRHTTMPFVLEQIPE